MMEAINHLPGELIFQRGFAVFAAIAGGIGVLFGMASAQRINFGKMSILKNHDFEIKIQLRSKRIKTAAPHSLAFVIS